MGAKGSPWSRQWAWASKFVSSSLHFVDRPRSETAKNPFPFSSPSLTLLWWRPGSKHEAARHFPSRQTGEAVLPRLLQPSSAAPRRRHLPLPSPLLHRAIMPCRPISASPLQPPRRPPAPRGSPVPEHRLLPPRRQPAPRTRHPRDRPPPRAAAQRLPQQHPIRLLLSSPLTRCRAPPVRRNAGPLPVLLVHRHLRLRPLWPRIHCVRPAVWHA